MVFDENKIKLSISKSNGGELLSFLVDNFVLPLQIVLQHDITKEEAIRNVNTFITMEEEISD